jgi:hypothetical protein
MPDRKQDRTGNVPPSKEMQCHEFDLLLTDAVDGVLTGVVLDRFLAHAHSCKACGPLLTEAEAGHNWLKGLTEVEPPANLVVNILASTTGVDSQRLRTPAGVAQPGSSWLERLQASVLEPMWTMVRQPRFAMSFGMAFFALSVGLTVTGVKPADLQQISLRPAAIRHTYYNTQARVVRYYDNIHWVYEMQAAVRRVKRDVEPAEPGPVKQKGNKNDTTQQPEQKQERNYSQAESHLVLASAQGPCLDSRDLPVVSVTTYRRFV